jgi:hypothetical protein
MKKDMNEKEIVKCACGLPMRQKDWAGHWRGCYAGSSVPVTEQDRENLLAYEERRRKQDEEHKAWLAAGCRGVWESRTGHWLSWGHEVMKVINKTRLNTRHILDEWKRKSKMAATKMKKWNVKLHYYEKRMAAMSKQKEAVKLEEKDAEQVTAIVNADEA